jgi:tetratricopeptide (TPR) repeat protein
VLVARFKAQEGSAHYDVSQRIYDALTNDFGRYGQTDIVVYQVSQVIESSQEAMELGQQSGATLVVWGFYDDIGISPNIQTLGIADERGLSVGLERLDTGDAAEFRRYIAKDLPEELSFLTALSLVQIHMLQGDLGKTLLLLGMASENLPTDPQFRTSGKMVDFIQGMIAFFAGDLEGAVRQMDRAITSDPNKTLFYTMRALAHIQLAQVDEALADLEKAVALESNNEMAYVLQGAVAWMMGNLEAALGAYDRLIELEPDVVELYLVRSMMAFEKGDLESARDTLDRVEQEPGAGGFVALARGLVYEKMGQSTQAAADYARAVELAVSPDQGIRLISGVAGEIVPPYAYLFQCTAYQARGDIEEALNSCDRVLEADPLYPDAYWKRGQLYAAQGNLDAALVDYTAALEVDPRWPWIYYLRAQVLIELGRGDEAQADLARAWELQPVDELREKIENLRASGS